MDRKINDPDRRKNQLKEAKAAQRKREKIAGRVELKATVSESTKLWFQDYQVKHDFKSLGEALDEIQQALQGKI